MAERHVLTGNDEVARADPFRLINNTWNIGDLVNGVDFHQRVLFDPGDLTSGARFSWTYGANPDNSVRAYPEIAAGYDVWGAGGSRDLTARIDSLKTFEVAFDVTPYGEMQGFNVAFDLWLTSAPGAGRESITTEVMVWLRDGDLSPAGDLVGRTSSGGHMADVHTQNGFSAAEGLDWRYIALDLDADLMRGSIDLAEVLRHLERKGLVAAEDYVIGYELGAEVSFGKGALRLNSVSHVFEAHAVTNRADRIAGGAQDDLIAARGGDDRVSGGGGRDDLSGGPGADRLYGGRGDDFLAGGAGTDRLKGGSGRDRLDGGDGSDILTGGGGADRFVFAPGVKRDLASAWSDEIADFSRTQRDRIDLRAIDANPYADGDQAFAYLWGAPFTGQAGELRVEIGARAAEVRADLDGDGGADFTLHLRGVLALASDDFLL
jgi:hypothetical protein